MLVKESSNRDTYSIIKGMTIEKQNVLKWSYLYLYKRPVICEKSNGKYSNLLKDILSDKDSLVLEFYRVS